jgi:hypothetical protein
MVQAKFYPSEDTSEFRLSVRAPPKDGLACTIVNLLKLYMYPAPVSGGQDLLNL